MIKMVTQVLEKVLPSGKKVMSQTLNGKTFTSVFDEAGNLLKTRIKHFKKDALGENITRYTTQIDYKFNEVTKETAKRMNCSGLRYQGKNPYVGTEVERVNQQLGNGNLLSSKSYFKHPNGQIETTSRQWTPFDFSNVHRY